MHPGTHGARADDYDPGHLPTRRSQ
jgi:hypothetical protein